MAEVEKSKAFVKVKDDINFLEYPNWIVSSIKNKRMFMIEKERGKYVLSVPENIDHLPIRKDKVVLYTLLGEITRNSFKTNEITTTRYKLAKYVYNRVPTTSQYNGIIKSLKRWFGVRVIFEGLFYNGKEYTSKGFGIIDDYEVEKDGKLRVRFNKEYLNYIKDTNYYKYVNFEEYRKLKRPVSVRLYELLIKTFKDRKIWKIDIKKLAEKLTLELKYPSHIYAVIKPAINEINRNTELSIELEYDKDTKVCTFKLKGKKTIQQQVEINQKKIQKLIDMIPQEKRTAGVIELINSYIATHGKEYVFYNIVYANNHAKSNYKAYLKKALENNYGQEIKENVKAKQEIEQLGQLWSEQVGKRFKYKDKIYTVSENFFVVDNDSNTAIDIDRKAVKSWIEYIKKNLV